ncbi:MAG TPA: 50S ribosomal protein L1 [Patescibacteria group bacterium]|nr:50S ribosomal protein L1 [Patescibacteria group bacterium]
MGKMKTALVGEENKNKKKQDQAHKADESKVHVAGLKGGQRVKVVDAAVTEEAPIIDEGAKKTTDKKIIEKVRGKKYIEAKAKFDREKSYKVSEAVKLVKSASYSKFDGTMELHIVVKKTGTVTQVALPFQAGRQKKVEIADEDTVKKLQAGKVDFDILVSTADMMPKLVPFARLLGPKGLMPNPKNGTLVADLKKAKAYGAGSVTLKTEKEAPLIHTVVGKNSQKDEEIIENTEAVLKALGGAKQIVRVFIKSTMSPSVKIQVA